MLARTPTLLIAAGLVLAAALPSAAHAQTFLAAHFGNGGDGYGDALAMLGDLDGDGRCDYLIGDYADDTAGADAGRIQLYSGIDHSLIYEIQGGDAGDWFGRKVAAMGDLDNDGVPDWAVSSPREVPVAGATRGGRVALRSGATGAVIRSWTGGLHHELGDRMVALDDLDNDGLADIAFSRHEGAGSLTAVEVRSSGTGALLVNLPAWGPNVSSNYAYSLTATDDLDGDGLGDLALGTHGWLNVQFDNRLRLHSSATGALIHEFVGVEVPWGVPALAMLGDLDDDGVTDFAYAQQNIPGDRVTVVSGAGFNELWHLDKPAQWSSMGRGLVSWPDIDDDGHDDIAIQYHQGIAFDFKLTRRSGLDGSELGHLAVDPAVFKNFGTSMVRGPDLDGDGIDDLLLACSTPSFWSLPGAVRVVSGDCDGEVLPYGVGLAGSGGFTPRLETTGCPAPGVPVTLSVRDGLGSAPAILVAGITPISVPFMAGTLLVDPATAALFVLPLSGPMGVPGAGSLDLQALIPDDTLFSGFSIFLQLAVPDTGAPVDWALSAGVEWRFG